MNGIGTLFPDRMCRDCPHAELVHQHHRAGTDCAGQVIGRGTVTTCRCRTFRPRRFWHRWTR